MPRYLDRIKFPKIVTVLAVTFGVALGACGLTALSGSSRHSGNFLLPLALVELAVMLLSLAGLILTLIVWLVVVIIGDRAGGSAETQKLFDDSNGPTE